LAAIASHLRTFLTVSGPQTGYWQEILSGAAQGVLAFSGVSVNPAICKTGKSINVLDAMDRTTSLGKRNLRQRFYVFGVYGVSSE